ncbi:hypothetical protein [Nocardia fluminea]|uniref:hypothetical protein n=1 Tax=Nocardia fluminea TaxID=134984 RepID=UPI0033D640EB
MRTVGGVEESLSARRGDALGQRPADQPGEDITVVGVFVGEQQLGGRLDLAGRVAETSVPR